MADYDVVVMAGGFKQIVQKSADRAPPITVGYKYWFLFLVGPDANSILGAQNIVFLCFHLFKNLFEISYNFVLFLR